MTIFYKNKGHFFEFLFLYSTENPYSVDLVGVAYGTAATKQCHPAKITVCVDLILVKKKKEKDKKQSL